MTAGVEEPNALVTIGDGGRTEPNTRATDVFVYEGLVAKSQNRWPNLSFDIGAVFGLAAPALSAGFYYKTFFGSAKRWMFYEYFIRKAAGLGNAPTEADPDRFSQRAAFCDVLGGGATVISRTITGGSGCGLRTAPSSILRSKQFACSSGDPAKVSVSRSNRHSPISSARAGVARANEAAVRYFSITQVWHAGQPGQ